MSRWIVMKKNDDYLMHYGVQGMKWGVRNFIDENGHLTQAGKERYQKSSSGQYKISGSLNKKKQAIESTKARIKALTGKGFGKKNAAATQEKQRLRDALKLQREDYKTASAAEREQKRQEKEALRQEQSNLKSIHNYISGNKRLLRTMEKNKNLRFKGGQNKKIDFEQTIGQYNRRTQAQIDARKQRNQQNEQNLKNENERLRNMDIREATSESNMAKIRNKYVKKRK